MNELEILQELLEEKQKERPEIGDWFIEDRDDGYWAIPCEPRFWGDDGEFLGTNYKDAKHAIIEIFS